jgi:manganese/iron transport system permease protein
LIDLAYFAPVMVGGALAGASTGLLGAYIVGMRIPFLGVCVSHAALAGAVFGALAGLEGMALLVPAIVGAGATALALGLADPETFRTDSNVAIGFLFGLSMGLAFLGIGLFGTLGKSDNEVRGLLWGSLNFCRWRDVVLMAATGGALLLFLMAFYKEMRAILFSRLHAAASGIHVVGVWSAFLVLTSAVLTVNFQTVGGLMIYSLMVNPAAAAFLLARGHGRTLALSGLLGGLSGVGGFLIAALLDLPTGAVIVLVSSALVGVAAAAARLRRRAPAD